MEQERGGNPSYEQFYQNTKLNFSSVRGCAGGQDDVTEEGIVEIITACVGLWDLHKQPQLCPELGFGCCSVGGWWHSRRWQREGS